MRVRTRITERLSPVEAAERLGGLEPACLVAIAGPLLGVRAELDANPLTLGRSSEAGLTIPHASVSRQHCRIWREDRRYQLEDLGSTNRTYVNGTAVMRIELVDGDRVKIGDSVFKFFDEGSVEADYQKQLIDLAVMDELTSMSNRRHFLGQVEQEMAEARRQELPLALIIADLDHFKPINDEHGHLAGDGVLRGVAETISLALPDLATAGRLGGEEFGILLPERNLERAVEFAERLRMAVAARRYELGGKMQQVTASFGVALLLDDMLQPSGLLRAADLQLYRAKADGRNRVSA